MKKSKYLDKVTDIIEDDVLVPTGCSDSVTVDYKVRKSGEMVIKLDSDDGVWRERYPCSVAYSIGKTEGVKVRDSAARVIASVLADAQRYRSGEMHEEAAQRAAEERERIPTDADADAELTYEELVFGGNFKALRDDPDGPDDDLEF